VFGEVKKYLEFVKFSHTVFALPFALASMALAAEQAPFGHRGWPGWKIFLLTVAAMATARTTAMAFNRIVDRKFDAQNPRTKDRHLPAGQISLRAAWTLTILSAAGFVVVCWMFGGIGADSSRAPGEWKAGKDWLNWASGENGGNWLPLKLSPVALVVIYFYSFTKRFTAFSHFFLGIALALAPLGAWIAVRGRLDWQPVVLAAGVVFWLAGFDTIYATLDEDFDRKAGLRSLVVALGPKLALRAALVFHLIMMACLLAFGLISHRGSTYFIGLLPIYVLIFVQHFLARKQDAKSVNIAFFRVNAAVSIWVLLSVLFDIFIRSMHN
jgi:4-hydroxybenzoate polyprenyltransferase